MVERVELLVELEPELVELVVAEADMQEVRVMDMELVVVEIEALQLPHILEPEFDTDSIIVVAEVEMVWVIQQLFVLAEVEVFDSELRLDVVEFVMENLRAPILDEVVGGADIVLVYDMDELVVADMRLSGHFIRPYFAEPPFLIYYKIVPQSNEFSLVS